MGISSAKTPNRSSRDLRISSSSSWRASAAVKPSVARSFGSSPRRFSSSGTSPRSSFVASSGAIYCFRPTLMYAGTGKERRFSDRTACKFSTQPWLLFAASSLRITVSQKTLTGRSCLPSTSTTPSSAASAEVAAGLSVPEVMGVSIVTGLRHFFFCEGLRQLAHFLHLPIRGMMMMAARRLIGGKAEKDDCCALARFFVHVGVCRTPVAKKVSRAPRHFERVTVVFVGQVSRFFCSFGASRRRAASQGSRPPRPPPSPRPAAAPAPAPPPSFRAARSR
jgi:hypothetical protein